jgi:hemoglobin/transferrin/lactoferrin receptor protein
LSDVNGKANITNFGESDSIFFQHPSFSPQVFLKADLEKNNIIYLKRRVIPIDEFVISASKYMENKRDIPFMIDVLKEKDIDYSTAQNAADVLLISGNICIQKTQGGGGSPVIRGFEANKILLVIDGVRMNNAIYRSGHLQNAISIDNSILERIEVIYGPTSLIYGSDALGGVIHYYTRDPELSGENKSLVFNSGAYTQYSTANQGKTGHLDFNLGGKYFASLTSISYKDFGDIRMGENKNPFYGDFGELKHYVRQFNGIDSTVINPDPYLQVNTGYSQTDLLQKFKYSPSKYFDWILNLQYSTSSEIDRLDFLNDYKSDGVTLDYARHYYGPQNRFFSSLKSVVKKSNPIFSNMTTTLAYQRIDEDRYTRKFRRDDLMAQKEDVHVLTLNQDFLRILSGSQSINYGLEMTYNRALSSAYYQNIRDNSISPASTRYPDGGTNAWSAAAYTSYKWVMNKKYQFAAGIRYQYSSFYSEFIEKILPYEQISISNPALTGSLSLVYHPGINWQINTVASTGFRSPNVDDYGKVRAKDGEVTVPNPGLSPEYTYNFEIGISKTIEGYLKLNATGYYTLLTNAIVRTEYSFNGNDSLVYDGDSYRMITNSNAGKAYIRGLSFALITDETRNLIFKSTLNLTQGAEYLSGEPMAHIPPAFGRTALYCVIKKFSGEVYLDYNGWKKTEDMSPFGEDNQSEATSYGFPSWNTFNIKTNYRFDDTFQMQFAIENIFDTFYKSFASGVVSPGRNFIISLRVNI